MPHALHCNAVPSQAKLDVGRSLNEHAIGVARAFDRCRTGSIKVESPGTLSIKGGDWDGVRSRGHELEAGLVGLLDLNHLRRGHGGEQNTEESGRKEKGGE